MVRKCAMLMLKTPLFSLLCLEGKEPKELFWKRGEKWNSQSFGIVIKLEIGVYAAF